MSADPTSNFSLSEARKIVADLFTPRPWIYWTDFLLSWTVGIVCFRLVRESPLLSPQQVLFFVVAGLAFYRITIFTHELIHLRDKEFRGFRIAWNLLCGIPFLMPSFTYYTHLDHHRRKFYGTDKDGEYLPLGTRPPFEMFLYLLQPFLIPILAILRFGVLTPLTWISPRLRKLVYQRASSMVSDPSYIRPLPTNKDLKIMRLQELAVFGFLLIVAIGLIRQQREIFQQPVFLLTHAYLTAVFILMINAVRTLGAHRYTNHGDEMTFIDQLLDSVNYPRRPILTELWAPLGMRFHALHHLFPGMPYHNLPAAHRRLMQQLPADSPYRQTECDSLPVALAELWQAACESRQRQQRQQAREKSDRQVVRDSASLHRGA